MKQTLKEKKDFLDKGQKKAFFQALFHKRWALFYLVAIIWVSCPMPSQAEQYYPRTLQPVLIAYNDVKPAAEQAPVFRETEDIHLTIREALFYSLQGNQDIKISAFAPHQAREDLLNAQAVYDPSFNVSGNHDRALDAESNIEGPTMNDESNFKVGVKQFLTSGGTVSLFLETQRYDKKYDPFNFKERYTSAPTVELKQPLLKNLWAKAEKSSHPYPEQ